MSIIRASKFCDPFSHEVWDPFAEYSNVVSASIILPRTSSVYDQLTAFANPRIDSKETQDAYLFKVGLPGLKRDEVKVHLLKDSQLEISGERRVEKEEKSDKWRRVERSSGAFVRKFKLPENVKADQVKAELENGVLTVKIIKNVVNKSPPTAIPIS